MVHFIHMLKILCQSQQLNISTKYHNLLNTHLMDCSYSHSVSNTFKLHQMELSILETLQVPIYFQCQNNNHDLA